MGATTKTGRKNIKSNNSATRFIPFDVFDKEQLVDILEEQIIIVNNTLIIVNIYYFARRMELILYLHK